MRDPRAENRQSLDLVAVMPGAASLGSYQAGAMAGLVTGVQFLRSRGCDVRLPAIGGASAGASVALLAAHTLAQGLDPVRLLERSWVERVDIDLLTAGADGPLGLDDLRDGLRDLLLSQEADESPITQPLDVDLHIALTTLRGYRYELTDLGEPPVDAVTYADWSHVTYPAGSDPQRLCEPAGASAVDMVVTSASNPVMFPPRVLDRSDAGEVYARRGIREPGRGSDRWWFTDGGLVQSRPVRRTLDLVPDTDRDLRCAIIDPRSEGPSTGARWADPDQPPDWLNGLMRALSIFPAQILSDELRDIDRANRVLGALAELSDMLEVSDSERFEEWATRHDVEGGEDRLFRALLAGAAVGADRRVRADVISPLLVADEDEVAELLAGELLGDFAGFLSKDLRSSDFALGYACSRTWWHRILPDHAVASEHDRQALDDHLVEVGPPPWKAGDRGETQLSDISLRQRAALVKVLSRAFRAAATE